jgi:serine/threonine protein kinase
MLVVEMMPRVTEVTSLLICLLHWRVWTQGGLTLAQVLSILKQVVAGLLHLHSLGILHRDLRAANLLIDSLEPLRVLVADFGVSHQLSAFKDRADASSPSISASVVPTVLEGPAALGPIQASLSQPI